MAQKAAPAEQADPITMVCGLVMPISSIDGCSAEHWIEVKQIISDAIHSITEAKFAPRLVSDADDVGVIQKRIVQGVYTAEIVVCDVSGKNPNVMFELGMRLAFDRPTVIIKDDKTDYSFDTSPIEHLTYPRDLRFQRVVDFKQKLASKVLATYLAWQKNPTEASLLKSFGTMKVAHLQEKEVPANQLLLEMMGELQREVRGIRRHVLEGAPAVPVSPEVELSGNYRREAKLLLELTEALVRQETPQARAQLLGLIPQLEKVANRPWYPRMLQNQARDLLAAATRLRDLMVARGELQPDQE